MYLLGAGRQRTGATEPDMVVMGADDDGFVSLWPFSLDDTDDIFYLGADSLDRCLQLNRPSGDDLALGPKVLVDGGFKSGQRGLQGGLEDLVDGLVCDVDDGDVPGIARTTVTELHQRVGRALFLRGADTLEPFY